MVEEAEEFQGGAGGLAGGEHRAGFQGAYFKEVVHPVQVDPPGVLADQGRLLRCCGTDFVFEPAGEPFDVPVVGGQDAVFDEKVAKEFDFLRLGWRVKVSCLSGAVPVARARSSSVTSGLTISQILAERACSWVVRAVKRTCRAGLIRPVPSSSMMVRSSVRQQWAQSPWRTGSSSRLQRVQWKSFGIPAQSTQQGIPSVRPGSSRQVGQVPWMRVAVW
ncbi:hypothetical protein D4765_10245 [Subtercola vilae]|uniref:Uncharacterized protein n=1 Tax=Subtercola vilae TaxID=2056433 RepID=A0A4V6U5D7_9MICO|nr:hypothetical protein D4765_10245 [Subtercola vilae]